MDESIRYALAIWFTLILSQASWAQHSLSLSGYVYDAADQKPLANVSVAWPDQHIGTYTNALGYFSLAIPAQESLQLTFALTGYTPQTFSLPARDTLLTVTMVAGNTLREVVVKAPILDQRVSDNPQMSQIAVSIGQITKVPSLFGEKDVLKVIQLLPGVQKGSEGNAGIYVRGGGPDQNLILLDGATVYNPNHLLGFFSAFNSDALRRVELTKGGFPARFGGRVSSVIEMDTKIGGSDTLRTEASIGIISSRITADGPLLKSRVRFMLAARRTYVDLITEPISELSGNNSVATKSYFYDLNGKFQWQINARNKFSVSTFFSRDQFSNFHQLTAKSSRASLGWQNTVAALRWDQVHSENDLTHWSVFYSQYGLSVSNDYLLNSGSTTQLYALRYQSGIRDMTLQYSRERFINPIHELRFGIQGIYHRFTPDAVVLPDDNGGAGSERHYIDVLESGLWLEDTWKPTTRLRINGGLRLSHYELIGSGVLSKADKPNPPVKPVIPKEQTSSSEQSARYIKPEPRLSIAYVLQPNLSLKASYATMNQYVHLLSSTGVGLPTDLWIPTTSQMKPQQARQVAVGLANDLTKSGLTLTLEAYYKTMNNLISYKEGASFLSRTGTENSQNWANNITTGRGWSEGVEVLVQKKANSDWLPRLSGWIGYTLSQTKWQFDQLNGGKPFFPRYDRRHDASIVLLFELTSTMTLAGTWVYGTGNALTLPLSRFPGYVNQPQTGNPSKSAEALFGTGPNVKEYGDRNSMRAESYHRLDLNWQIRRRRRIYERTWSIGVYNAYNRRNPFYYSLEGQDQGPGLPSKTVLYRYSIFSVLPSVSYSIKF
ncbi:TonB-dependent receptor [Spirosoma harenae]